MSDPQTEAVEMVEADRRQLANEIHDSLMPLLFAARAGISTAIQESQATQALTQAESWLEEASQVARRILIQQYPPALEGTTWYRAAGDTCEQLCEGVKVDWQVTQDLDRLPNHLAGTLYRIVIEAIRNVQRHAKTDAAVVTGRRQGAELQVDVVDRGIGFDPASVPDTRFGLRSMRSRAKLVGGRVAVQSQPGGPTSVAIRLPLGSV
ncbi:MAG: ATP-binding protein [Planctomycetota bacterium]